MVLTEIGSTSATMSEAMRSCALRAGLSRSREASSHVLGNPKAWLGTAYHEVLERIAGAGTDSNAPDGTLERLWRAAIDRQHQRAQAHTLDARYGDPDTWPGYHLAHAAVRVRAEEMLRADASVSQDAAGMAGPRVGGGDIREREFTAFGGKLRGRPDVIRVDEVIDYKSGAIVELDEATQSEVVKSAYVRQLRIYGYLVHQTLGNWPSRGLLLPLVGAGVQVPLIPAECVQEATEAVALLDAYNAKVRAQASVESLAAPSPANCKWCPFKLICPPFWEASSPAWSGNLDGAAVEGVVPAASRRIHGGAALALSIDIESGTELPHRAEVAPLQPSVHPVSVNVSAADRVRVVGLRARQDGKLIPTLRTVLARVADLPIITTGSEPGGGSGRQS